MDALENYLSAYLKIFTSNPRAAKFKRHYVDAFAGSGLRSVHDVTTTPLDPREVDEAFGFVNGSVRRILSMNKDFHKYWFVEKDPGHASSLQQMVKNDFPDRFIRCEIVNCDANEFLLWWSNQLGSMDRAVVFLDPYGMSVQWATIEKLASTQKVDLWMLFPASSVMRMLPKQGPPDEAWSRRLTEFFGDEDWREEFYQDVPQGDMFGERKTTNRIVNTEAVSNYLLHKLKKIFSGVVEESLVLRNSKNSPLFMLVFAAGNPLGAMPAISIASDIIKNA